MTREELIERLGRLNVSRRGHRPALYKPLLLLLLLSRTRKNGVREISFAEIESDLKSLVERYSPEDSAESIGQPWWHLPTDGLWRVYDEERTVVRELGTPRGDQRVPSLDRLPRQHGEFEPALQQLLAADPESSAVAMEFLVQRYFSDSPLSLSAEFLTWVTGASARAAGEIGQPYSNAGQLHASVRRDPFEVDPDVIDRGNQAHASTVDALADYLRSRGIEPRRPEVGDPMFDLAWTHGEWTFVAEIKSVTVFNEEKQLRLGVGQVLRYRQALECRGLKIVPVLVPEREPADPDWAQLCHSSASPRLARHLRDLGRQAHTVA